jgi:hypothetical protein
MDFGVLFSVHEDRLAAARRGGAGSRPSYQILKGQYHTGLTYAVKMEKVISEIFALSKTGDYEKGSTALHFPQRPWHLARTSATQTSMAKNCSRIKGSCLSNS